MSTDSVNDSSKRFSRRSFMKATLAAGAAAGLYGCSKSDSEGYGYGNYGSISIDPDPEPPKITEEFVAGITPHNCGGSCLTKVHVRNGVIRRVTTDETPEKHFLAPKYSDEYGDLPQERNCPRCRSTMSWIYGTNRLMYPLIQTKERGNLAGFRRATWEEAANYIKAKAEYIRKKGPGFYSPFATGAWGATEMGAVSAYFAGASAFTQRNNYSWPCFDFLRDVVGTRSGTPPYGDNIDYMMQCDEVVLWSSNITENILTNQSSWYLTQLRELGKKFTVVEPRFHQTATVMAQKYLPVIAGTDGALVCALIYVMLKEKRDLLRNLYNVSNDTDLRREVSKWIYGFFDSAPEDDGWSYPAGSDGFVTNANSFGPNNSYRYSIDPNKSTFESTHRVIPGGSFSAYILGGSETDPSNQGPSIYPDSIGYNANPPGMFPNMLGDPSGRVDPLYGKRGKCYGQVAKTPEWAEKITGVKAEDIRELAHKFLTKNMNVTICGGIQRTSESEYQIWALYIMLYLTRCFGRAGRNYGILGMRNSTTFGSVPGKGINTTFGWSSNATSASFISGLRGDIPDSVVHDLGTDNGYVKMDPTNQKFMNSGKSGLVTGTATRLGDNHAYTLPYNPGVAGSVAIVNWLDYVEASQSTNTFPDPVGRRGQVKASNHFNTQVMGAAVPVNAITASFAGSFLNQSPDTNHAVRVYTATDDNLKDITPVPGVPWAQINPYGYKIGFLFHYECVMSPSVRWCDVILPGTAQFERFQIGNQMRLDANKAGFTHKAVNPPGEALPEIAMAWPIAKAHGRGDDFFGNSAANIAAYKGIGSNMFEQAYDFEYKAWASRFPSGVASGMTMREWSKVGMVREVDDLLKLNRVAPQEESWRDNPASNMRNTVSGRVEAFSITMMELYESRFFPNIDHDENSRLKNNAQLYSKNTKALADANPGDNYQNKGRIVYPIPMYVPIMEGIHAAPDDDPVYGHPDPMELHKPENGGYTNQFMCWHPMIRAHSSFSSVPLLCELKYWKRNSKGESTYPQRNITNVDAGADHFDLKETDMAAPSVWVDDVYETAWIHPLTKYADGSDIQEGDVVVVSSLRGSILVSAHISHRVRPRLIAVGQGSWYDPIMTVNHGNVDRGGCVNTLFKTRGSRINQCTTFGSDCRVKLEKFMPHPNDER